MKILHVIGYFAPRYGGPPVACLDMAKAMAKAGHEVSIYTTNIDHETEMDVPLMQSIYKDAVEIKYFPVQKPRFWIPSLPLLLALKETIPLCNIVHIHSLYLFHVSVAAFFCRWHGIPYVISPHGALDPFLYKWHRFRKSVIEFLFDNRNVKNCAAVHFITREEQKLAKPYILGANSFVAPLGINLEDFENLPSPGTFKSQYPQFANHRIILFLGRINFKKGLDILVKAFAKVSQIHDDVHLVIVGPDNEGYGAQVKEFISAAGVTDRVFFTGILHGAIKLAAFVDAELFVLPSYTENFGIAVVEAMACGLPVIISNQVNIWQEISAANAGKVCACDVEEFAETILEILTNQNLAQEISENGKNLVKNQFEWSKIAQQLEDEYNLLLKIKPAPAESH